VTTDEAKRACVLFRRITLKFLPQRAEFLSMSQESSPTAVKTAPSPTIVIAGVFIYAAVVCLVFGFLAFR